MGYEEDPLRERDDADRRRDRGRPDAIRGGPGRPASQILTEHESFDGAELRDDAFVHDVDERIARLATPRATFVQRGTDDVDDIDVDLL